MPADPDNTPGRDDAPIRLAAVGDILLAAGPDGRGDPNPPPRIGGRLAALLADQDVVFGNLECTLPDPAGGHVETEPRVVSTPEMIGAFLQAGRFDVVTLANNHMFDCLAGGFRQTVQLLDARGVAHFGAGEDVEEAGTAVELTRRGRRLAMLAAVDDRSGPSRVAGPRRPGVAPLEMDGLVERISALRERVEHVLVSVHWGEERFLVPSPEQIDQARAMVEAGAHLVIGHHPHVTQGFERWAGGAIIYSLGNFIPRPVHFSDGDVMHWNRCERTGEVLLAELTADGEVSCRRQAVFEQDGQVELTDAPHALRRRQRADQALVAGVTAGRYRREYLWVKTIRPTLAHLRWSKLRRLRWRNVRNALRLLRGAARAR